MICPNCKREIADGSLACPECGVSFTPVQQAPQKVKKPIYKKWWFWVLIVVVILLIAAMTGGGEESTTNAPTLGDSTEVSSTVSVSDGTEGAAASSESTTQNSDVVLYEGHDIKITYKASDTGFLTNDIKLFVENNSTHNVTVSVDTVNVNGYTVSGYLYTQVAAGKKANDALSIYSSDLSENGIDKLETVEITFNIIDSDTYDQIEESYDVTLNF